MPVDLNLIPWAQIIDVGSRALVATQLHLQRDRPCQALSIAEQCGSFAQQLLEGSTGSTCPACSLTCPASVEPAWYIAGGFGAGFFLALVCTLIGQCLASRAQPVVPPSYTVLSPAGSHSRVHSLADSWSPTSSSRSSSRKLALTSPPPGSPQHGALLDRLAELEVRP